MYCWPGAPIILAAFAPDKGESVNTLIADPPPGAPVPLILPPKDGFLLLDATSSTARSPPTCRPSRPRSWPTPRSPRANALGGSITDPAWRAKPS
jgi:hypothetical protein